MKKAKYTEERLVLLLEEYINSMDFITRILWNDVVKWAKMNYPHEMQKLSYEYFSRSPVLRSRRDAYNAKIDAFITDKDSVDSLIQDYGLDWCAITKMNDRELQEYITKQNMKIAHIVESYRKLQLRIETMKRIQKADQRTIRQLTIELEEERTNHISQRSENSQNKKKNASLNEQVKALNGFIETHINTPIVQQHFLELGILAPLDSSKEVSTSPDKRYKQNGGEIISAGEASIIEKLGGIMS